MQSSWSFDGGRLGVDVHVHEVVAWEQQSFGGGVGSSCTLAAFVGGEMNELIERLHGKAVLGEVRAAAESVARAMAALERLPADAALDGAVVGGGALSDKELARVQPDLAAAIARGVLRVTDVNPLDNDALVAIAIAGYWGVRVRLGASGFTHRSRWPWEPGGRW